MPLKTFKCLVCGFETEELVKVDTTHIACKACEGGDAIALIEAPHIDKYSMQKFMRGARGDGDS